MLSRRRRLRASEVAEVVAYGRSVRGGHLSLKFLKKNEPLRIAVVVPKSLAKKANVRNRLRRAAYDSLAHEILLSRTGRAIFFVRSVPQDPLRRSFREEALTLLAQI